MSVGPLGRRSITPSLRQLLGASYAEHSALFLKTLNRAISTRAVDGWRREGVERGRGKEDEGRRRGDKGEGTHMRFGVSKKKIEPSFLPLAHVIEIYPDVKRICHAHHTALRGICNVVGAQPLVFQFGQNCLPYGIFSLARCPMF